MKLLLVLVVLVARCLFFSCCWSGVFAAASTTRIGAGTVTLLDQSHTEHSSDKRRQHQHIVDYVHHPYAAEHQDEDRKLQTDGSVFQPLRIHVDTTALESYKDDDTDENTNALIDFITDQVLPDSMHVRLVASTVSDSREWKFDSIVFRVGATHVLRRLLAGSSGTYIRRYPQNGFGIVHFRIHQCYGTLS